MADGPSGVDDVKFVEDDDMKRTREARGRKKASDQNSPETIFHVNVPSSMSATFSF